MTDQHPAPLNSATDLHIVESPRVFRALYQVCKTALTVGAGSQEVRNQVAQLRTVFRQESLNRFGHEINMEETALGSLLNDTSDRPMVIDLEDKEKPLDRLFRLQHIDNDEYRAAGLIEAVWGAYEKFLGARITQAGQGTGSGRSHDRIPPLGRDLGERYARYYSPWYDQHRFKVTVVNKRRIKNVDLVFAVVVQQRTLKHLSAAYGVPQQGLIDVIKGELLSLSSRMQDADQSSIGGELAYAAGSR